LLNPTEKSQHKCNQKSR